MPTKQIPTLGDSNWGTPLNDHLSQLHNPTTGGINTFEQFSQRPTNLTTDDTGKTYLFTITGNIHQWMGTSWKVLNESVINVKDYGAIGDFDPETGAGTNDSAVIQALLDRGSVGSGTNKTIFFPEGVYGLNVTFKYNVPNIIGQGHYSTVLSSYSNDGYVFTFLQNNNWLPMEIKDVEIRGNSALTRNGIQFGRPTFEFADQYCASLRAVNMSFTKLDIAINKRYGNIGNSIEHCYFTTCNYHYKAYGYPQNGINDGMNSGCDTFYKCQMDSAKKASIFVDGKNSGVNGMLIVRDCIIEGCPGFGICINNYDNVNNSAFTPGFILENTWFEFNAVTTVNGVSTQSAPIDIDGTLKTPRTLYFNDANALIENCMIYDIELIKSKVIGKGCGTGIILPLTVIKDNYSSLILDETELNNVDCNFFTKLPQYSKLGGPYSVYCNSSQRSVVSHSSENLVFSDSYSNRENILFLGNTGMNAGTLVKDGTLFDRS
jgi:hypothetical protein